MSNASRPALKKRRSRCIEITQHYNLMNAVAPLKNLIVELMGCFNDGCTKPNGLLEGDSTPTCPNAAISVRKHSNRSSSRGQVEESSEGGGDDGEEEGEDVFSSVTHPIVSVPCIGSI